MKTRMLRLSLVIFILQSANAQDFPYGSVVLDDLLMTRYDPDTMAGAVVLKEFGEAFISDQDYQLVFKYHVRIKVLKKSGLNQANIQIPLHQQGSHRRETILGLKASSFNIENDRIHEEVLESKNIFTEDSKYLNAKKFAIPNVRVGSVIELSYSLHSPFIFNFRTWEFQSDIPKIESEYWASIPGVYVYNITIRGYQELSKQETKIIRNCLGSGTSLAGAFSADCAVMKLGMRNIPAFVEEDYMTAKKNFLSAIHFELSEVKHPDGRVDKVTKEWKDAEQELRTESRFGAQLKKGREIGEEVRKLIEHETDTLAKAKKVYEFIRGWYLWNETDGKYSEFGIKKAFDERRGNVGDINLSLIAALRFAGVEVEPVILSTRANGAVIELHPVLSDFNYVIAKVNIGDKVYLADATAKFHPFGLLPERCLNGKGRVIADRSDSYWIDLKPSQAGRTISMLSLRLGTDGVMRGSLHTTFAGYDAVEKRREIGAYESTEAYIRALTKALDPFEITGYALENVENYEKSIVRKLNVEMHVFDPEARNFLLSPFFLDRWSENPFKSQQRLYPVDFGVPLERISVFNLEYPADFEIVNLPERAALSLPGEGGRFILEARNSGNKLSLNNSLSIRKTVYTSLEYHYLKELFSRIIQIQSGELIFRKKT